MDYFFYLLSFFMWANSGLFLMVALRYKYKVVQHKRQAPPASCVVPATTARR
jgi:hypothetical protein